MQFDVLVVGAGPAGLAAAIRLKQVRPELHIAVIEKGAEVGAHILSGAVFDPKALDELLPDWKEQQAPVKTKVNKDRFWWLGDETSYLIPPALVPPSLGNQNCFVIGLGKLCRWLATQAEALGIEIYPGFTAAELLISEGVVEGVVSGDMGRNKQGQPKPGFAKGIGLKAKYTLFAEGSRGHLGKRLIERFGLANDKTQHYALGFKELWRIPEAQHQPGLVYHSAGWPLSSHEAEGGGFIYHLENQLVSVGLIVDLNYRNPNLDPFEEFQRYKLHPMIRAFLEEGERIGFGARSLTKGGLSSLPKMSFPGGLLIGCDAGTLNPARIKGSHTAMKSGIVAADVVATVLDPSGNQIGGLDLIEYGIEFKKSWAYKELHQHRNFGPALHKFGSFWGGSYNLIEQGLTGGHLPFGLEDKQPDHHLDPFSDSSPLVYPKPDGRLSFDRPSSVYLSHTQHDEDQPCHLKLKDEQLPIAVNLEKYDEPAQRYCPAGVYEVVSAEDGLKLQINATNCLHCKACDIKEPSQNIEWVPPEGGGGPNYGEM